MRPHGRVRLPAPETHGPARLRAVHPARERPRAHRGACTRLHLRLRVEGAPHPATPGIEDALAFTPKLREGPLYASVRARGRRHDGVQGDAVALSRKMHDSEQTKDLQVKYEARRQ